MANDVIKAALETRLKAMVGVLPTAWENANFNPPATAYQEVYTLFAEPDDKGFADSPYLQRGIFQVALMFPTNTGSGAASQYAKLVVAQFKRGTTLVTPTFNIIMERTPEEKGGAIEDDRYVIRVNCRFFAYVPR